MGLQLVVQANDEQSVSTALGPLAESAEVFPVAGALWGVSVPTKLIDSIGEKVVRLRLAQFNVYDLYNGKWVYA